MNCPEAFGERLSGPIAPDFDPPFPTFYARLENLYHRSLSPDQRDMRRDLRRDLRFDWGRSMPEPMAGLDRQTQGLTVAQGLWGMATRDRGWVIG
jgi:hypothetical protein